MTLKQIKLCLLLITLSSCGSATDKVLDDVVAKRPDVVGFRDVHEDDVGNVCGKAIDRYGRVDRFLGIDGEVSLESEMDLATLKGAHMGPEIAEIGPGLKRGFLRAYEDCMVFGS